MKEAKADHKKAFIEMLRNLIREREEFSEDFLEDLENTLVVYLDPLLGRGQTKKEFQQKLKDILETEEKR